MLHVGAGLQSHRFFETIDLVILTSHGERSYDPPESVRVVEINAPRLVRGIHPLANHLRVTRPDAVLAAGEPANIVTLLASRLARSKAKTVLSVHTHVSVDAANLHLHGMPLRLRLIPRLVRYLYPIADSIVAVSEGVARDLTEHFGIESRCIKVIHNPVLESQIDAERGTAVDHPWLTKPRTTPVFLAAGRLVPQKDFPTLLRAFKLVRREIDARLIVLGQGPLHDELVKLGATLGISDTISFPGFVRNPYAWMSQADVFVLSSAWEGFGNVLVEALACGTPVVSTDCPSGPAEILRGGEIGPLVPVGDVGSMAEALISVLRTPPSAEKLRARARDFSLDVISHQYGSLLYGLCDG